MNSVPNSFAVIIGAMKCGTTSLFYYLSEHPEIAASREKEVEFFCNEERLARGMTWYRSMWQFKPNNHIALEASSSYTKQPYMPNVAERIAHFQHEYAKEAEFRFIYIMRHPFRRIESHISHQLSGRSLTPEAIKAAKSNEANIAYSRYAMQLDAYAKVFGRERLHLTLIEDLEKNPQAELCRICHFLEIDPKYQFKRVDVVRNSRETTNLHPVLAQLRHKKLVKPLVDSISPKFRQKLRKKLSRRDPIDIKLDEQDKELLLKRLQPDLARLEAEYGIDVQGKWGLPLAGLKQF